LLGLFLLQEDVPGTHVGCCASTASRRTSGAALCVGATTLAARSTAPARSPASSRNSLAHARRASLCLPVSQKIANPSIKKYLLWIVESNMIYSSSHWILRFNPRGPFDLIHFRLHATILDLQTPQLLRERHRDKRPLKRTANLTALRVSHLNTLRTNRFHD